MLSVVGKKGNISTCSPALSSWRTRSSRSWAGKWRAPTSSSPSLCRVMVILRSCRKNTLKSLLLSNASTHALDWVRGELVYEFVCVCALLVTSPCYPPGPPQASESAPSPPRWAVSLVLSSLSTAAPGSPEEEADNEGMKQKDTEEQHGLKGQLLTGHKIKKRIFGEVI